MNLADSVKFVLKSKSQNIFGAFWKEDIKNLLSETKSDVTHFFKSSPHSFKYLKSKNIKVSAREALDSAADALTIVKVIPHRVRMGFSYFKDDFVNELENLPDQKQKTIFCLKVMGALSSFVVGALYNYKIGNTNITFPGLKQKNAFTQFLIAELIIKISQMFIMRFITEVEKHLSDPDELHNLRYFKVLFSDREKLEAEKEALELEQEPNDRSIEIVDELKNYIMTGTRRDA